jgi:alpha-tubulin suppressor-like RCC1 family protein
VPTTNASDSGGFQFDVLGGAPPVTYRYRDSSQAGSGTGTVVEVIDSMRNMASIAIDVKRSPPLVLYPAFAKAVPGDRITFVATGGKGPYEFSLNGNGKIGETTGIYTAPMESGSDTIQLKDSEGHLASSEVVIQQDAVTVNRIGLGNGHTCVLSNGVVKCSGDNRYGQLGDGTMADRTIPVPVAGLGRDVLTIAAGYTHNCVLAAGGGVKCWGDNRYGQLGNGSNNNSPTAMVVFSLHSGVQAIAAGQYHSCAVVRGGVYCWGSNRRGQLGDGTANPSSVPVAVKGLQDGIIAVVAGAAHTCALSKDGAVKCWGYNFSGQLGQGTTQDQVYPVEVSDLQSGVKAVFAGGYHTCALTDNKDLKCWGSNSMGQLGSDNGKISVYPRLVSGFSGEIKGVATGYYHTCAWNEDSTQCWGYNSDGQLGDNTKSSTGRIKPEKVEGLEDVLGLAAGVNHNCALVPGGMRCWGNNQYGQFGNRSIAGSAIPIPPTALK